MKAKTISLPKTRLLTACLLLFSLFFIHQSCTKVDTSFSHGDVPADAEITQKFFNVPSNSSVAAKRLAYEMKERNNQLEFVKAFVKNNGYPVWDKVILPHKQASASLGANAQVEDTTIIVPVVPQGGDMVGSFIRAHLNGTANFSFYRGSDYSAYSFNDVAPDSINADKAALQLIILNNVVFNYSQFDLKDKRLFHPSSNYSDTPRISRRITLGDVNGSGGSNYYEQCLIVTITTTTNHCPYTAGHCYGPGGNCDNCNGVCADVSSVSYESCSIFDEDTSGSGGPSGGGGAGGGGGTPNNFPCANSQAKGIPAADPCGPGNPHPPVVPVPPRIPPVSAVNDSIPNILSRACDRQMDSLYNWGMQNGFREQSFILVKKNGVIYPKNFRPGTTDQTSVNYFLEPDEILLAYGHTHAEDTIHFYRTSFDGQDLAQFDVHATELGYAAILEIGNARYCFVLENVGKHSAFNIARRGRHKILYQQILDVLLGQTSNVTLATEQAMVQYLGSASSCGVGLYKATAPNKNNFIKLNP